MKTIVKEPLTLCQRCAYSTIMKHNGKRIVHCGVINHQQVPDGITECSDFTSAGLNDPARIPSRYRDMALVIDTRPDPGQVV